MLAVSALCQLFSKVSKADDYRHYKDVSTLERFVDGFKEEEHVCIVISTKVRLWPSVLQCWCVRALVCVTSVLCPCGWCCIHLSVTQKQMSPGWWGAADCRGDCAVAGWRCLRPAVPSRWEMRSLAPVLFIAPPPIHTHTFIPYQAFSLSLHLL